MGEFLLQLLVLLGALGLIYLAINMLGSALHGLSGFHIAEGLRANLKGLTSWKAYHAGFFSTATSLSTLKSYTTIIGYTNSRLLTQIRAGAAMRGALTGELVIVWFVALMITIPVLNQVSLPICGLGYLSLLLFPRVGELKFSARIFLSVGLMLIGITLSKSAVRDITFSYLPEASEVISYTSLSGFSIFIGVVCGMLLAALFRSSAITVILALLLGVTIVGNPFAIGLSMGAPLGLMFSLVQIAHFTSASSRRVIVLHSITMFVAAVLACVTASFISDNLFELYDTNLWVVWIYSIFIILYVPLAWVITRPLVKLVNIVIANVPETRKLRLLSMSYKPDAALMLLEVDQELLRHNRRTYKMFSFLRDYLTEESIEKRQGLVERIEKYQKISDTVHREILAYLSNVNSDNNPKVARRMHQNIERALLASVLVDNLVSISRIVHSVASSEHGLSPSQVTTIEAIVLDIQKMYYVVISDVEAGVEVDYNSPTSLGADISRKIETIKESYYPYNHAPMIEVSIHFKSILNAIGSMA